jgi:predicted metal-dependent phosphoesterase TrpH
VQQSESLHQAARELAGRAVDTAKVLLATQVETEKIARGGRKGNQPMIPESPAELAAMMEAVVEPGS